MKAERRLGLVLVSLLAIIIIVAVVALANSDQFVSPPRWTEATDSSVPGNSSDPSDTSESSDPSDLSEPSDLTESSEPSASSEPAESSETAETTETEDGSEEPELIYYPDPRDPMEEGPLPSAHRIEALQPPTAEGQTVSILAGGDVLMHSHLINGGLEADGQYDYSYAFQHLTGLTAAVDFAYLNMEGTLAGPPYTGFPLFSAPDAIATAIRGSGFDMAKTANNHAIDKGSAGLDRTYTTLEAAGLIVSGSRRSLDDAFYQLVEIGGVEIAFATYTYETIRQEGRRALNALVIPEDMEGRINSFSLEEPYMSEDFTRMGRLASFMREAGADFVVFNIHWGTEYSSEENWYQKHLAQLLADHGVDLIVGNGPHVIQPIKEIRSTDGGHKTLVFYSVGNLLSDQVYSTGDSAGRAEDGILAEIHLQRSSSGTVEIRSAAYISTYVYKEKIAADKSRNTIIPIRAALQNPQAYGVETAVNLLQASLARTEAVMSQNEVTSFDIQGK